MVRVVQYRVCRDVLCVDYVDVVITRIDCFVDVYVYGVIHNDVLRCFRFYSTNLVDVHRDYYVFEGDLIIPDCVTNVLNDILDGVDDLIDIHPGYKYSNNYNCSYYPSYLFISKTLLR